MKNVLKYSIICFLLVSVSGIASVAIYRWCPLCVEELKEIGPAGDAIAGISAIILGAFGVAATFAAFYIQYKANISLHEDSLKEGFDRKFFELVNLFAQSTSNIQMKITKKRDFRDKTGNPYEYIQGKNIFQHFHDDFISLYNELAALFQEKSVYVSDGLIQFAFSIVYYGQSHQESDNAWQKLDNILNNQFYVFSENGPQNVNDLKKRIISIAKNFQITPNNVSYNELLCHYFKQLYFIVKYVVNTKEISDEQYKNYFGMLCGQLSFNEQLMLFYSWIAGLEKDLVESQLITVFREYGLINDVLDNSGSDNIDIRFILGVRSNPSYSKMS